MNNNVDNFCNSDTPNTPVLQEKFEEEYRDAYNFCEDVLYSGDYDNIRSLFGWLIEPVALLHMLYPEDFFGDEDDESEIDNPPQSYPNRQKMISENYKRFLDSHMNCCGE